MKDDVVFSIFAVWSFELESSVFETIFIYVFLADWDDTAPFVGNGCPLLFALFQPRASLVRTQNWESTNAAACRCTYPMIWTPRSLAALHVMCRIRCHEAEVHSTPSNQALHNARIKTREDTPQKSYTRRKITDNGIFEPGNFNPRCCRITTAEA